MKKEIYSINAPKPIGPYSQAIKYNNMIFISGQIAINPKTKKVIQFLLILKKERVNFTRQKRN